MYAGRGDKLRKLRQSSSVSTFLSEFRNLVLKIPDILQGENLDKYIEGLKYEVRVEVLKSNANTFEETASITSRVEGAIWTAGRLSAFHGSGASLQPTPVEFGNINAGRSSRGDKAQRDKGLRHNACFKCYKTGCRT